MVGIVITVIQIDDVGHGHPPGPVAFRPVSPVRVYFDIEGNSERTFAYLLGLVIDDRGIETRYSLWADTLQDEQIIFGRMLEILGRYDDYTLFHYGSYESSF